MLNSVPLFVRAVSKGNELYRIQTKSLSTLLKSPLTGETKSIWSGSRTIFDLTMSSLLAWGFHKLMMHFGMDTEGFKVWTWSSDEREMDFSLISCLWSNNVFKNDNLGLASLTNPLPDLYLPFPFIKQWLWSQCETETLLVLGVYYLCVKNVGLMCGQCRSSKKTFFFMVPFLFVFLFICMLLFQLFLKTFDWIWKESTLNSQ